MRYRYNHQIVPPAPCLYISIAAADGDGWLHNVPAQIDTAADRSVVPWSVVDSLSLPQLDELPALGFGGHLLSVPTFLVSLAVRGFRPLTVEVFANRDEPLVLLGRDVLNYFKLVLDGPRLVLEIEGFED
jgi:hypothetical protein